MDTKTQPTKRKIIINWIIKIKTFSASEDMVKRMKFKPQTWEKMFTIRRSAETLLPIAYNKFLCMSKWKTPSNING